MSSINKVILTGNLTRDPELRYSPRGVAIVSVTLAVNRTWKTEQGENRDEVAFVDVTAFGRQAEVVSQYFQKGSFFIMSGRLHMDSWEDKQTGGKRTKLKVILEEFTFAPGGNRENGQQRQQAPRPAPARQSRGPAQQELPSDEQHGPDPGDSPADDDDVPF